MRFKSPKLVLVLILFLALFLRFVNISQYPMYGDELTLAYDGYSILKTGFDQTGAYLPFTFKMAGGHPPAYVYFSMPFIAIFGATDIGIRLLSVISGMGIVLLIYLLGRKLVNEKTGLFAAGLVALSPWDIHLSRIGFETHFALFLTTLGVYLFLKAKDKHLMLVFSALSFGVAIHTYSTYKLTVPLLILILLWFIKYDIKEWFRKTKISYTISASFLIGISFILIITQALFSSSETRFLQINVFNQPEVKNQVAQKVNIERTFTDVPFNFSELFHNKVLEFMYLIKSNYLEHFSTEFLFLKGDGNPRHNGAGVGELYIIEAIFLLLGVIYLSKTNFRVLKFLILWLLVAPIPTSLISGPHVLRSSLMFSPLILLSGVGFYSLWEVLRVRKLMWLRGVVLIILLFEFIIFAERHYFLSANLYNKFFSYSAKAASEYAVMNKNNFDYILMSDKIDSLEIGYPVYAKADPQTVIAENRKRSGLNGVNFKKIENVYIGYISPSELEQFSKSLRGSVLYLGPGEDIYSLADFEVINAPDNSAAVVIKRY